MNGREYLLSISSEVDEDQHEYIVSIALDASMSLAERVSLVHEFLESSFGFSGPVASIEEFVNLCVEEEESAKNLAKKTTISEQISNCFVHIPSKPTTTQSNSAFEGEGTIDPEVRKLLLKQYDPDSGPSSNPNEEEDEILGLGPNENRLRIAKEREIARQQAKEEHEANHAEKIAQKLKMQGAGIKSRTVTRHK